MNKNSDSVSRFGIVHDPVFWELMNAFGFYGG